MITLWSNKFGIEVGAVCRIAVQEEYRTDTITHARIGMTIADAVELANTILRAVTEQRASLAQAAKAN